MCQIEKLAELCRNKTVYIQTHNFPDPDAIASAFGLQKLLHIYGIDSKICYSGRIDNISISKMLQLFHIEMHAYDTLQKTIQITDYIICVDCQKNNGNLTGFTGQETAVIDHHPTFSKAEYFYEDLRITGACASLIASYFEEANITPDPDTATALLYGIKMDTLQFSRGVTPLDISMFAFLYPLIDQVKMKHVECNNMELSDLRAYGAAIEHIKVYGTVGFSCIPFSCPDALIASISNFMLSLEEVQVSIIFAFRDDGIKFSVRSEISSVHAGELIHRVLKKIGSGGGHAGIAGGLIPAHNIRELGSDPENHIIQVFLRELQDIVP